MQMCKHQNKTRNAYKQILRIFSYRPRLVNNSDRQYNMTVSTNHDVIFNVLSDFNFLMTKQNLK